MRVYRTPQERNFTPLPNNLLQRRDLSFTALGILVYLLSLPDDNDMTVAKLERARKEGKAAVRAAIAELREAGYYIKENRQDERGLIRGYNAVCDTPYVYAQVAPTAEKPSVGEPTLGGPTAGISAEPPVKETQVKKTLPSPVPETAPEATESREEAPKGWEEGEDVLPDEMAACAPLVARLSREVPRLTVGVAEMGAILPLVAEWRRRGASDAQIIAAVVTGLPAEIRSPVGLIRDRLTRKMPPVATVTELRSRPMIECPGCGRPGRSTGLCRDCRHVGGERPVSVTADAAARGLERVRRAVEAARLRAARRAS